MRTEKEIKQTVIAILTVVRDGNTQAGAGLLAGLNPAMSQRPIPLSPPVGGGDPAGAEPVAARAPRRRVPDQVGLTAAAYAMSLFQMLAAEFEAACPDADVQAFLRRQALELASEDEDAA